MSAIIAETYAPAQWRNDLFYRGGQAREGLKNYIESGDVKSNEMAEVVTPELERYIFSGGDRGRKSVGRGQGDKVSMEKKMFCPSVACGRSSLA